MNKQIGFDEKLVPLILSGEKSATWRLNDKRNLTLGDVCDFINSQTNEKFAVTKITKIVEKPFKDLSEEDKVGHEKFATDEEMYKTFEGYYKQKVEPNTLVKIAWFDLI